LKAVQGQRVVATRRAKRGRNWGRGGGEGQWGNTGAAGVEGDETGGEGHLGQNEGLRAAEGLVISRFAIGGVGPFWGTQFLLGKLPTTRRKFVS
jgi:hypothetical protein